MRIRLRGAINLKGEEACELQVHEIGGRRLVYKEGSKVGRGWIKLYEFLLLVIWQ